MKKQRRNHNLVILLRKEPLANGSAALIKREKANLLIVFFSIIILLLKDMGVLTEFVVFRVLWPEVPIARLLFLTHLKLWRRWYHKSYVITMCLITQLPTAVNHSSFNCFFRQLLQISGFATHLTP